MAKDSTLDLMFPVLTQEWEKMNSSSINTYQEKLEEGCKKAVDMLTNLIDSGSLELDLEQAVQGFKVMTDAQRMLMDSKRKLAETMVKSAIMIEALKPPKETKPVSLLDNYINSNPKAIANSQSTSIFTDIDRMNDSQPEAIEIEEKSEDSKDD